MVLKSTLINFFSLADLLGDRVAIMAQGKLRCLGSPLFLKNKFGVGYTLTIVKTPLDPQQTIEVDSQTRSSIHAEQQRELLVKKFQENCDALIALVQSHVPEAQSLTTVGAEQSFRLPFQASAKFVQLFEELDLRSKELGIAEYGISVTTLEEVFIRVGNMVEEDTEIGPQQQDSAQRQRSLSDPITATNNMLLEDIVSSQAARRQSSAEGIGLIDTDI